MSLAALVLLSAVFIAALEAGFFRGYLMRFVASRAGRQIQVEGRIDLRLFSLNPRVTAERVAVRNPPWMPPGVTAEFEKVVLVFDIPRPGHSFGIKRLEMEGATLHLARDSTGHANWQQTDPDGRGGGSSMPIIQSLSMTNARVVLDDARRHLQFDGTVSAGDRGTEALPPLRIVGTGRLNGRGATFEVISDPLAGASHDRPYRFTFTERSSGSRLVGGGFLTRPFDFDVLDTTFDAQGEDLKDLYYLTGVALIETGGYHVAGKLARRGTLTEFNDLVATSGQSDLRGHFSIESSGARPKLTADFNSQVLHLADLGARAAGRAKPETGPPLMLSTARLNPETLRRTDAAVNYHAGRVDVGRVPLHTVAAKATIDRGVLAIAPLSADLLAGRLTAHLTLDANTEVPAVALELKLADARLGQVDHNGTGPPPLEGLLQARATLTGPGRSVHEVAAHASGTVTAVLPHGTARASLAELAGLDLRGLGLFLAKDTRATDIRCGVASFQAQDGTFTARSIMVDTDPVLITGEGHVNLDSEALDLAFRGHPKKLRLFRLHSPVLVRGTLVHPSIGIQTRDTVAQVAEAVALGVVLTPLASVLAFVDPGLAKDADCASILAASEAHDGRARAEPYAR